MLSCVSTQLDLLKNEEEVPFIDWRKPWILQGTAGITEGEILLLAGEFLFQPKVNSKLNDSIGALFDEQ